MGSGSHWLRLSWRPFLWVSRRIGRFSDKLRGETLGTTGGNEQKERTIPGELVVVPCFSAPYAQTSCAARERDMPNVVKFFDNVVHYTLAPNGPTQQRHS